jgi:hypothetical protein
MGEKRIVYRASVGYSDRKTLVVSPGCEGENGPKIGCEDVNWIKMAQELFFTQS